MKWTRKYGPLAAGCLSLLAVSLVLYFLLDTVFNGVFVDWVESTFMLTWEEYVPSAGTYGIVQHINWHWVKPFLLGVLVVNGLLWAGAVFLTRQLARRKKEQEDVRDIAERLRQALDSDGDASQVFPPQQQEIAAQVAEWKSKLQRREQALQQETARKNDLITYLAHDLKTPLTSVIGYLSLLDEVPDMPQPQREKYTHIALEKSQRLEGLINEFFDITRYNLQQLTLEKEPVDVSYLLVQLTDEFYPLLQAHGNTIELNVPQDLTVEGDAGKLARELAQQWVAVPGTSEHQLGLAVDLGGATYDVFFWLQEHSWEYGFIWRYPGDKTDLTGTAEEVWHYRYVGKEAAKEIYEQGVCLEEYLEQKKEENGQ